MSFLSHAATFAGGFVTGFIAYGITIGDDPNDIWETAKKGCGNVSTATVNGLEDAKDSITNGVTQIKSKFQKQQPVEEDFFEDEIEPPFQEAPQGPTPVPQQ